MAIVTPEQNIRFNTTLDDVVVLDVTGDDRTIVIWDALSPGDQALLTNIINDLGGNAPMVGPTAGYTDIYYVNPITGGTPSGLTVNDQAYPPILFAIYTNTTSGDAPSGLDTSGPATHGYQDVFCWPAFIDGTYATGLADDATIYTATITVDGVIKNISVVGSSAQTIAELLNEINTDLEGTAVASLVNVSIGNGSCDIRIVSATTGNTSTVEVVDGTLFASLTGLYNIDPATAGRDSIGGTVKVYTAIVEIDGVLIRVEVAGNTGATLNGVTDQIAAALGNRGSVYITAMGPETWANVFISNSTGPRATMRIYDTGWLFSSLAGFSEMWALGRHEEFLSNSWSNTGWDAIQYTCIINVDGTDIPISCDIPFVNNVVPSMASLIDDINVKLGGAATAAIVNGKIRITSATTGPGSNVNIKNDTVFNRTNEYAGIRSVDGAANLAEAFKTLRMPNGTTANNYFPHKTVGARPPAPLGGAAVPKTIEYIYWGGTPADWRYFHDDSEV